jgi:PKD repeat protein
MTCRLDLDNDGTYDMTVSACTSASLRTATFTAVGPTTVKLQVSDSGAAATATTTVTVGAASGDQFHIDFRLDASVSPDLASVFEAAAARWAAVVKTGLADTHVTLPGGCFGGPTGVDVDVDDILIDARIAPIDGAGGALAEAGPCAFRADGMPSYGVMWFDSDDAGLAATNPRLFLDTITHEMGHVLGINSSAPNWAARLDPPFGQNPVFTGPAANGIFQALGGTGTVPMVTGGGHFSDAVFNGTTQGLLMTGAASATRPDALGAVVAAALADAGYGVDLAGAEPYSLPGATPAVGGRSSGGLRYDS